MTNTIGAGSSKDGLVFISRVLLMLLFVIFGWQKLIDYSGTQAYFTHAGIPMPQIATFIAVVMEFFAGVALIAGVATRPLALLMALYTLGAALLSHHFWTMEGMVRLQNEINFFKNVSIIAGLMLLYVTGPGKYSIDSKLGWA